MPVTPLMSFVKLEAGSVPTSSVAPTPQRSTLFATWYALHESIIGQTWSLELVSTLTKADLTTLAITDSRRATAKTATVKGNVLSVQFADIDLSALAALYPARTAARVAFRSVRYSRQKASCFGVRVRAIVPRVYPPPGGGTLTAGRDRASPSRPSRRADRPRPTARPCCWPGWRWPRCSGCCPAARSRFRSGRSAAAFRRGRRWRRSSP